MKRLYFHFFCNPFVFALCLYFSCNSAFGQSNTTEWTTNQSGNWWHGSMDVDSAGNVYSIGSFEGNTHKIWPVILNKSAKSSYSYFLSSYTEAGKLRWAESLKSSGWLQDLTGLAVVDADIYFTGRSDEKFQFGQFDIPWDVYDPFFLAKSDLQGNIKWVKHFPFTGSQKIIPDGNGNLYINFYEGRDSFLLDNKIIYRNKTHRTSTFLAKIDTAGSLIWAKEVYSQNDGGYFFMDLDPWGNIYISSAFYTDEARVGNKIFQNQFGFLMRNTFITKLNANGEQLWAKLLGVSTRDYVPIKADKKGNVYLAGYYYTNTLGNFFGLKYEKKERTAQSPYFLSQGPSFLLQMDTAAKPKSISFINSIYVQTNHIYNETSTMDLDSAGNIYVSGEFQGEISAGRDTLQSGFNRDHNNSYLHHSNVFIAKYNSQNKIQWVKSIGKDTSNNYQFPASLKVTPTGNAAYLTIKGGSEMFEFKNYTIPAKYYSKPNPGSSSYFHLAKIKTDSIIRPDSFSYVQACNNDFVSFQMHYNSTLDSVLWNFGDGETAYGTDVNHFYKNGAYTIQVTCYIGDSVWTSTKEIEVRRIPQQVFKTRGTSICTGTTLLLNVEQPIAATYLWQDGTQSPIFEVKQPGKYKVQIRTNNCMREDSITVTETYIAFSLGKDTTLCKDNTIFLQPDTFHKGVSYYWNTGQTDSILNISKSGVYTLITRKGNCSCFDSVYINFNSFPANEIPADTAICEEKAWKINMSAYGGTVAWQDGTASKNYTITTPGAYNYVLKNACGIQQRSITVKTESCNCFLYVPNVFSPNKDSINDIFKSESYCIPLEYELLIYNRWGERIFETKDLDIGWDGTYKEGRCPPDVYFYQLRYKLDDEKPQIQAGRLLLMR